MKCQNENDEIENRRFDVLCHTALNYTRLKGIGCGNSHKYRSQSLTQKLLGGSKDFIV